MTPSPSGIASQASPHDPFLRVFEVQPCCGYTTPVSQGLSSHRPRSANPTLVSPPQFVAWRTSSPVSSHRSRLSLSTRFHCALARGWWWGILRYLLSPVLVQDRYHHHHPPPLRARARENPLISCEPSSLWVCLTTLWKEARFDILSRSDDNGDESS